MAKTLTILIFILFNISVSNGFSLKLTHRDSPQSPLFNPNLSDFERFTKNIDIIKKRSETNDSLILPLAYREPLFTVELALGTPLVKRTFIFDTGSDLTWTQCKPCVRCFKQKEPLFDFLKSKSYKTLTENDNLPNSFMCNRHGCVYHVQYYSGQSSSGIVSIEIFYFNTTNGNSKKSLRLIFGCGIHNMGSFSQTNVVSGIFGLNKDPASFARQLSGLIKDRFSYCLPGHDSSTKQTYLRFGDDINGVQKPGAKRTPFLKTIRKNYVLNITDISIDGQRLGLKSGTFPEGCVVDSGSSISLLSKEAYAAVGRWLDGYFSKFRNVRRVTKRRLPKGFVCYNRPTGFARFPNMTLHFEGGDFGVAAGSVFVVERRFFCLAMMTGNDEVSVLGARQQQNVRLLYDLKEEMLTFMHEDCSKDAVVM